MIENTNINVRRFLIEFINVGVLVDKLGHDQKSICLTKGLNKLVKDEPYFSVLVYYMEYDKQFVVPNFSLLHDNEAFGHDGPCIATNFRSARRLLNCVRPTRKFYFLWDLDWLYESVDFEEYSKIIMNKELELLTRNTEYQGIIQRCWNKPVTSIEDIASQFKNLF